MTERADVTALLGVHWQVRAVGAQLTETLATLTALKGLVPRVHTLMHGQAGHARKALATLTALK